MRQLRLLTLVLAAVAVALLPAQENTQGPVTDTPPDPALVRLRDQMNPEFPAWGPEYTFERAAEFVAVYRGQIEKGFPPNTDPKVIEATVRKELYNIRFLSAAEVPRLYLPAAASGLFFGVNSAARIPVTILPQPVPDTDNRLYWIDLRWFNWSVQTWENIALEDPYYREPIIDSKAPGLLYVKEQTHSNAIVRADWFLWYVFDNGEFVNQANAEDFNEKAFYYQLLYSNVGFERDVEEEVEEKYTEGGYQKARKVKKKTKKVVFGIGPRSAAEFEAAWLVDFDFLKDFPIDNGGIIDKGQSGVVFGNRVVWRVPGKLGRYWRTFDVLRVSGDQDFLKTLFPKKFDAGEHIFVQEGRGAQFYLLSNGKGKTIDYANPFVVKGDPLGPHNTVLVTSRSCIHCHDTGILNFKNEVPIALAEGAKLFAYDPAHAERVKQFFLQERKMTQLVKRDQEDYAEFIRDCNGLTAKQNLTNFMKIRAWYAKPLDLAQAARELGADPAELSDALGYQTASPRLGRLALNNTPVPREYWERGGYSDAGLLLREWRKQAKMHLGTKGAGPKKERSPR